MENDGGRGHHCRQHFSTPRIQLGTNQPTTSVCVLYEVTGTPTVRWSYRHTHRQMKLQAHPPSDEATGTPTVSFCTVNAARLETFLHKARTCQGFPCFIVKVDVSPYLTKACRNLLTAPGMQCCVVHQHNTLYVNLINTVSIPNLHI